MLISASRSPIAERRPQVEAPIAIVLAEIERRATDRQESGRRCRTLDWNQIPFGRHVVNRPRLLNEISAAPEGRVAKPTR